MNRTCYIALATVAGLGAANAADFKTYNNASASYSWTWNKTKADQQVVDGQPQAVTYDHIGTLAGGLRSDSGSANASLRARAGASRIDNGLPELPPEPYKTATGTTYAYPVPSNYTGAFGLYAGDVSLYAAMAFPNAGNVHSGTYTQALVNSYLADPNRPAEETILEAMAVSRMDISIGSLAADTTLLSFQLRIQGLGPSVANVESGTYLSTYDALRQIVPVTLNIGGVEIDMLDAELLSYADIGVGSRHAYVGGGMEEVWEFTWDLSTFTGDLEDLEISFANYPSSVITGLAVNAVPEPSTYALILAAGIGGVALARRRRMAA